LVERSLPFPAGFLGVMKDVEPLLIWLTLMTGVKMRQLWNLNKRKKKREIADWYVLI